MLCNYGCGKEANFILKNRKHCCSKNISMCPIISEKRKNKKFTCIETSELCNYGCGEKAKYKSTTGKFYCSNNHFNCKNYGNYIKNNVNNSKIKYKEIDTIELCSYGCEKAAKFILNNGKHCCSKFFNNCSGFSKKIGNSNRNKKRKFNSLKIEDLNKICDYGCNSKANYYFPNSNKYCCSDFYKKCSKLKEDHSNKLKGKIHPISKETINKIKFSTKFTLEQFKEKHPIFCSIEEIKQDSDKNFYVRCKHCNEWFIPTKTQLNERTRSLESKTGSRKSFLYCCDDHKLLCPYFDSHVDPKVKEAYKKYRYIVDRITQQNVINYKDKIINLDLRGNDFHLDHKYSISEAFKNNIDPRIVGHWKNLEILNNHDNVAKFTKCSITLEQLIEDINI